MGEIDSALNQVIFKNQYDGCYERSEYSIVETYKRGGTHNCIVVRHEESKKELYTPDDPQGGGGALAKKWIKDNSVKLPPIAFHSFHSYFSRLMRGQWFVIQYWANPKLFNSPKQNYFTEESSEFHKANIDRYPEHKITMNKWISTSAKRHKFLEDLFNSKKHHRLDLDRYIIEAEEINKNNDDIVGKLKILRDMLQSGVINEEEFVKAKKKILNN